MGTELLHLNTLPKSADSWDGSNHTSTQTLREIQMHRELCTVWLLAGKQRVNEDQKRMFFHMGSFDLAPRAGPQALCVCVHLLLYHSQTPAGTAARSLLQRSLISPPRAGPLHMAPGCCCPIELQHSELEQLQDFKAAAQQGSWNRAPQAAPGCSPIPPTLLARVAPRICCCSSYKFFSGSKQRGGHVFYKQEMCLEFACRSDIVPCPVFLQAGRMQNSGAFFGTLIPE